MIGKAIIIIGLSALAVIFTIGSVVTFINDDVFNNIEHGLTLVVKTIICTTIVTISILGIILVCQ